MRKHIKDIYKIQKYKEIQKYKNYVKISVLLWSPWGSLWPWEPRVGTQGTQGGPMGPMGPHGPMGP